MINIQKMMQQAQQMQTRLQELQEKMADVYIDAEAGGGLVKVEMSCAGIVSSIAIDPSAMDDKETLEDLVVAAINNANTVKDEKVKQETQTMMKELGLPEGAQLPGAM